MEERLTEYDEANGKKKCKGCEKIFIPTLSNKFCRDCYEEIDAVWKKLMK